jgi:hypothetical protein
MNERIKALAREARLLTGWPVGEMEYQKFAELIIQECIEQCEKNADHEYLGAGSQLCAFNIKSHFWS